MNLEPPQPPTAPAPTIRPTPPTPPRIDRTPFAKNSAEEVSEGDGTPQVTRKVDTPETMARDAVANGSGALTKRTVERGDDNQNPPPNQTVTIIPPDAPLISDTQSDYDRGKDVLREFKEMDAREAQSSYNLPAQNSTEQRQTVTPRLNYHEGNGGFFWIFTIIFVAIAAVVVVKKFLFTEKPMLTKSQLFEDSTQRLKAVEEKVKPSTQPTVKPATQSKTKPATQSKVKPSAPTPTPPPTKPIKLPPKKDDDKGKHFEVRV